MNNKTNLFVKFFNVLSLFVSINALEIDDITYDDANVIEVAQYEIIENTCNTQYHVTQLGCFPVQNNRRIRFSPIEDIRLYEKNSETISCMEAFKYAACNIKNKFKTKNNRIAPITPYNMLKSILKPISKLDIESV